MQQALIDWTDRVMRSAWWPWAVLAGFSIILVIANPGVAVRGVPLPMLVVVGTFLAITAGIVLETVVVHVTTDRFALAALAALGVAGGGLLAAFLDVRVLRAGRTAAIHIGVIGAAATTTGLYLTAIARRPLWGDHSALARRLLVAAAMVSSIAYVDLIALYAPMRDTQLYLKAGRLFLDHQAVYLSAPLATMPKDPTLAPYLYPPFTLPFVAALATLPSRLAIGIMAVFLAAAVIAGLRLLGVRWRYIPLLVFWPPLAVGIQVGNVACLMFLALAAGWRLLWALPLGGTFKAQAELLSLWLVRERCWRALAIGGAILAALVLITLPLTGLQAYADWARSLVYFQETTTTNPAVLGMALQRTLPLAIVLLLSIAAVVIALLGRGRDGLARMAIASVVASPTVYQHGLSLFLPAILFLDASLGWALIGLIPWGTGGWWAALVALAALALGLSRASARRLSGTSNADADAASIDELHPLGDRLEPWADGGS